MDRLPAAIVRVLEPFAPAFRRPTWKRARQLLVGAILTPGARTVAAALRTLGLEHGRNFSSYHRVLSRARWSGLALSRTLLFGLAAAFVPADAELVFGIDETLERRRGEHIKAKGLYHDNARSSKSIHVRSHGLRWVSVMLLTRVPWSARLWALPFLTLLTPSERCSRGRGVRHKPLGHWTRQVILQLRRWLPGRRIVVIGDNNYSSIELFVRAAKCRITLVTRLRLDAALYEPAPSPEEHRRVQPRGRLPKKGPRLPTLKQRLEDPSTVWRRCALPWYGGKKREVDLLTGTAVWFRNGQPPVSIRWVLLRDPLGKFEPQALVANEPELTAEQVVDYYLRRWQVEVTFAETRAHLGIETQRQWSDRAIARTTPALFGLFSIVTLCAHELLGRTPAPIRRSAWYAKPEATFSDILSLVRRTLWRAAIPLPLKRTSVHEADVTVIPSSLLQRWTDLLSFAA
jgi:hypothetical protein